MVGNNKMRENGKENKFISAVVYLHNEGEAVRDFFDRVIAVFEANFERYEIVCVDDGCTDITLEVLREYLETHPLKAMVSVVHMSFFHGLESAMNAGRDLAIGDFVYEFDSVNVDYDPKLVLETYHRMLEGNDIVAATAGRAARLSSRIFYAVYNQTSRGKNRIGAETFRLVSRRAINRIKAMGQYIPYRKAVYAGCGLSKAEVCYEPVRQKRQHGKQRAGERVSLALDSFIYFTNVLEHLSAILCIVFLLFTVGVGIYIIRDYLMGGQIVEGWLSTMGFLTFGFFGVFALLTLTLKYLSVILNLIFKQQRYLIADIEKVAGK